MTAMTAMTAPNHPSSPSVPWPGFVERRRAASRLAPGPLLIIERDPRVAIRLVRALSSLTRFRLSPDFAHATEVARAERPALVLLSDRLPDHRLRDLDLWWPTLPVLSALPMMVLVRNASEGRELAALRAGALGCVPRQAPAALVRARVDVVLQMLRRAGGDRRRAPH